jgi:hypothetical protein
MRTRALALSPEEAHTKGGAACPFFEGLCDLTKTLQSERDDVCTCLGGAIVS